MMVLWSDLSIPDADSVRLMRLHEQPYVLRTDFVLPIGRHALTLLVADYANDRVRDTRANIFVVVEPIGASRGADADLHISVGGKTVECARAVGEAPDRRESRGGDRVELACVSDAGRQYTLVEGSSRSEVVGVLNQSVTAMIADMGLADQAHVAQSLALLVGSLLRDSGEPTFSVGASTEHWAVVAWAASDPSAYLAPLLCAVWAGLGYRVLAVLVGDEWGTDAALSAASAGIGALKTVTVARVSSAEVAAARVTAETFAQVRIHRRPRMRAQACDPSLCLFLVSPVPHERRVQLLPPFAAATLALGDANLLSDATIRLVPNDRLPRHSESPLAAKADVAQAELRLHARAELLVPKRVASHGIRAWDPPQAYPLPTFDLTAFAEGPAAVWREIFGLGHSGSNFAAQVRAGAAGGRGTGPSQRRFGAVCTLIRTAGVAGVALLRRCAVQCSCCCGIHATACATACVVSLPVQASDFLARLFAAPHSYEARTHSRSHRRSIAHSLRLQCGCTTAPD
jgi:hypothetical protein